MKSTLSILLLLTIAGTAALFLPTRVTLELYDVEDLCCPFAFFGDRIASPGITLDPYCSGEALVREIRTAMPGVWRETSGRSLQAQNGLLIVRATRTQHVAVGMYLGLTRFRLGVEERILRAKTVFCAEVFGMITK